MVSTDIEEFDVLEQPIRNTFRSHISRVGTREGSQIMNLNAGAHAQSRNINGRQPRFDLIHSSLFCAEAFGAKK
jgi:hypothetical protein